MDAVRSKRDRLTLSAKRLLQFMASRKEMKCTYIEDLYVAHDESVERENAIVESDNEGIREGHGRIYLKEYDIYLGAP